MGGPGGPGALGAWWLGTGGGREGALKLGGGGTGGGGRGEFLADLGSSMVDLLFPEGGAAGRTKGDGPAAVKSSPVRSSPVQQAKTRYQTGGDTYRTQRCSSQASEDWGGQRRSAVVPPSPWKWSEKNLLRPDGCGRSIKSPGPPPSHFSANSNLCKEPWGAVVALDPVVGAVVEAAG